MVPRDQFQTVPRLREYVRTYECGETLPSPPRVRRAPPGSTLPVVFRKERSLTGSLVLNYKGLRPHHLRLVFDPESDLLCFRRTPQSSFLP